jgi:ABC-type polysaccharide/polyol phosphate export permease
MSTQATALLINGKRPTLLTYFRRTLSDLFRFRFAFRNFVVNGIRIRYRRSNLGFLWTLLNPLLTMTVMSICFSYVFKQDIKQFSIFLFSGLAPFNFLSAAITNSTTSIVYAESYLKKIYVPKTLFTLITVSIEAVNFSFSITALYLLALLLGAELTWSILLLPFVLVLMFIFSLGVGLLLAVTFVYFRDIAHFVQVIFTALFYLTPILYPPESIPEQLKSIFMLNPLSCFVTLSRKVILGSPMTGMDWIVPAVISVIALLIGFLVLYKNDKDIIFRL